MDHKTNTQFVINELRSMANSIESGESAIVKWEISNKQRTERSKSFNPDENYMGKEQIIGVATGLTIELFRNIEPVVIRNIGWDGQMHEPDEKTEENND